MANNTRKSVTVLQATLGKYDLEGNLDQVMTRLQNVRNSIPQEYRESSRIDIDTNVCHQYNSGIYTECYITYVRPETDEEIAERKGIGPGTEASEVRGTTV